MSKIVRYRIRYGEVVESDINKILNSEEIVPLRYWKDQDIHSLSPGDVKIEIGISDYAKVEKDLSEIRCGIHPIREYTPEERLVGKIETAEAWINYYKKEKRELEKEYFELFDKYPMLSRYRVNNE